MPNEEIGKLNVVVNLDSTGFQNGISQLNRQMKLVQSEFQLATARLGNFGSSTDKLKLQADALTKQIEIQRQKVAALQAAYQQSVETKGADAKATQDLAIKLNKAQAQLATMENELKKTTAELERQSSTWYRLSQSAKEVGDRLKNVGDRVADVGKNLSTKVTAPIVGLGTLATKSAIDFESAFAGVRKTVDATEEQFAQLERGIRDMSKEIPASATAIAAVAEAAGQLGIQTENILGFTRVMIDLGEATNLSAEEAASALAQFANITQMSQKEFDRLGSTIVALGNNLATTERDIVEMGQRLAGAGAQVGLTEAQIMSFAAALSSVGIEAEAGGSAFSRLMVDMQLAAETGQTAKEVIDRTGLSLRELQMLADADGKAFKELAQKMGLTSEELRNYMSTASNLSAFAEVTGKSAEEFAKAFREDAAGAIIEFIRGLATAEERGLSAIAILDSMGITEIRLRDALLRAAGASDVFTNAIELGTKAWNENVALTKEAEQRYKTSESQLAILRNTLTDIGITIGQTIVPIVLDFAEKIKVLAERFASLSPETQRTILVIAGLAAAIGPALIFIGKLIDAVGTITKGLGIFAGAATTATTATAAAGTAAATTGGAFAALAGPVGIAIAAITGAVAAGVLLYKNWDTIKAKAQELKMLALDTLRTAVDDVRNRFTEFQNRLVELKDRIINDARAKLNSLRTTIEENRRAIEITAGVLGVIFGPALIKTGVEAAIAGTKMAASFTAQVVRTGIEATINGAKVTASFISSIVKAGAEAVVNGAKLTASFIAGMIKAGAEAVVAGAKITASFIGSLIKTAAQAVVTGAAITGNLIKAVVLYAVEGWKAAASIAAQTAAWLAQKTVLIASTAALVAHKVATVTLTGVTIALTAAQRALTAAFVATPWGWVALAIGGVIAAGVALYKNWDSISKWLAGIWQGIKNTAASIWNSIKTAITTPINNLRSALSGTWSSIVSSASSAWNSLRNAASSMFSRIRDTILAPFRNLRIPLPHLSVSVSYKSIAGIRIPVPDFDIRWYATGGIFNRPSVIGVGEKGPEAVIPIDRLKDLLGDVGQKQITINVYTNSADRIVRELRYQLGGGL